MPAASPAPVRVTAVSRPYPDGQRVIAAAIEYDAPVDATSVHPEAFEVENRTVVRAYVADGGTFRITLFPGDSIWREHQPGRTMGGGHFGTWHLTHQIEALRDWLFEQRRR